MRSEDHINRKHEVTEKWVLIQAPKLTYNYTRNRKKKKKKTNERKDA